MKKSILKYNSQMALARREGRKTQTRRLIDPQPECEENPVLCDDGIWRGRFRYMRLASFGEPDVDVDVAEFECPYVVGDRVIALEIFNDGGVETQGEDEISAIRVERLNDISEEDARSEGICSIPAKLGFLGLWQKINGIGSWDKNPWVWVIEFKKI